MAIISNIGSIYIPALLTALLRSKVPPLKETTQPLTEYDYIIVGSGPGGSIVANRLSEDPKVTVLLLEAGKKDNVSVEVPTMAFGLLGGDYDWKYHSIPQKKNCQGMDSQRCFISGGKVIGGSSSLSLMIHTRGNKIDFDDWSKGGNSGWSYDEVLPYFKKYENYTEDGKCVENKYHGCSGELPVSSLPKSAERKTTEYFIKGAEELGFESIDANGEKQLGVTRGRYTMRNGGRISSATAFLRPVQDRPNLHIVVEALVHKILIDPSNKSVTGVEFEKDGKITQIKARKEVILSAGTYSSPKILMLSGIGPKEELEKFKIPIIAELPGVGKNLQELVLVPVSAYTGRPLPEDEPNIIDPVAIRGWLKGTGGLMASSSGMDAYAFAKSKYETQEKPDLFLIFMSMPIYNVLQSYIMNSFGIVQSVWNDHFANLTDKEIFNIFVMNVNPRSRGEVTLNSTDPNDQAALDSNIFGDEVDKKILLEGIRVAQKFVNTSEFKEKGFKLPNYPLEQCKQYEFNSDESLLCEMKYISIINWCGCCTNKMGPDSDKMAVVDSRLRVKGISGLRVVDLSVFPKQISGVPAATIYMIGEKAAAMIKEDNQ